MTNQGKIVSALDTIQKVYGLYVYNNLTTYQKGPYVEIICIMHITIRVRQPELSRCHEMPRLTLTTHILIPNSILWKILCIQEQNKWTSTIKRQRPMIWYCNGQHINMYNRIRANWFGNTIIPHHMTYLLNTIYAQDDKNPTGSVK